MQAISSSTRVSASTGSFPDTPRGWPPCIVVFGRPGAGKSTVADAAVALLKSNHQHHPHPNNKNDIYCLGLDLDVCVPQWMRDNFANGIYPTLPQRETFAYECCDYVEAQFDQTTRDNTIQGQVTAIISFSFVNTDLRDIFRSRFPHAKWVLVDTEEEEAQRRIEIRQGHFYKGSKIDNPSERPEEQSNQDDEEMNNDNDDNSDWKFAPVTFDHVVLDGTRTIQENADRVVQMMHELIGVRATTESA